MENYNRQVNRVKNKTKAYEEALKENTERNKVVEEKKKGDEMRNYV